MHQQATTTAVLIGKALAHGDMGMAWPRWRRGRRRRDRPLGAPTTRPPTCPRSRAKIPPRPHLAILEPRPPFDSIALQTKAAR